MLKGKTILLGVTGGIAAYKAADLASRLVKQHAQVQTVMTENAQRFISPLTFEVLTGRRCLTDTFEHSDPSRVDHIEAAKEADLVLIAPATANVIAKLAHGIADDMLTSTFLACTCPVLIAPAMNTRMFENAATQANLETLAGRGIRIIEPAEGRLACGDSGRGKLPEPALLAEHALAEIACRKDLLGKKILVTAGPTQEDIDPVRYLTNHSSGKMGYAIAHAAMLRGAEVTLVSGPTALETPVRTELVKIRSAEELFREVTARAEAQDMIIKAAAVADYRPAEVSSEKVKKSDSELVIPLARTRDVLQYLGDHKRPGQLLCGFAMETSDMEERAKAKLRKKNLDLIAANNVKVEGAGFAGDTNVVTLITGEGIRRLDRMSKEAVAMEILDTLAAMAGS